MTIALNIIQIILAVSLTTLIFLQANGDTDGRSNLLSSTVTEKRGWEKVIFSATIFLLALFLISSLALTTV